MKSKGAGVAVSVTLGIVILVGLVIIVNSFGVALITTTSEDAATASSTFANPSSNQTLQLESVNLSTGEATVRASNCDVNGSIDAIIVNDIRYPCNPAITVTCGANTISFSDCSITESIEHTDYIKFGGPNLTTALGGSVSTSGGTGGVSTWTVPNDPPVIANLSTDCPLSNGVCTEAFAPTLTGDATDGEGDSIPTDYCWYRVENQSNTGVWIPDWTAIDTATGYGTSSVSWSSQVLYQDGISQPYGLSLYTAYIKCQDSEGNENPAAENSVAFEIIFGGGG